MRPWSLPGTNRLRFALHGGQRLLLTIIWPQAVPAKGEGQNLRPRHDPFVRPAKLADARRKKSTAPSLAPIDLQLHGVLNAGSNSMINIDGSIVRLQEEYAGYRP
ncbi:hypothetical protein, partial [Thiolapillus sp.]|uniref:hypothetical protein n=1 Tax=Thiolapillus sp. TaxID=2017437 RepID=UPI003AF7D51B